jgi:branched-chain amino acid transport system ATP-binding protein
MPLLEIEDLHTYYGNIHALKGISATVDEAEIVTLIGGNGAGKSTTLNSISGLLRPRQGSVRLQGEDLLKLKPHEIVAKGVVQVPEGRRVFARMTVFENLEMGAYSKDKATINENIERVYTLFPIRERHQTTGRHIAAASNRCWPPVGA